MIDLEAGDPITVIDRHGDEWPGFYVETTAQEIKWKRRENAMTTLSLPHQAVYSVEHR